jgi:clan AA aspartic protease (TIGR02281 family)
MTHFNKTLKTSPTDYNALYYSAIIYHRTGSVDQAKNTYGKLIKLYPNSDAARNALAALRYLDPKYASKFPGAYSSLPTRSSATASAGRAWSGGQSGGSTEVTSGPAESQIFFEDRGNAMVVDAYVNNRPVKMIFDTGAEAVVFGKNHLNELGIDVPKGEATGLSFGVGDGGAQRAWNTTATIKLGQIEKRNCPIAVHEEMPTLPLLGQTFFKDFQYSIQRGQGGTGGSIRFRRKDASSAQSIAHDSNAVPFSRQGNEIVVPVEINGRQTRMFFDTGAEQCVFSEAQLQQLGITVPEDAVEGRSIGIAGSTATKTFTVARMRLGSVEKTNVPISMVESYHMPLPLLGQTFFGDLRCELDNDAHLLRLRR